MRVEVARLDDVPNNPDTRELDRKCLETDSALNAWCFLTTRIDECVCDNWRLHIVDDHGAPLRPDTDLARQARLEALATGRMEEFAEAAVRRLGSMLEPWDDWPKPPSPLPSYWKNAARWWTSVFDGVPLDEPVRRALVDRYGYVKAFI